MTPVLQDPLAVFAAVAGAIAVSEWLARNTALRHVGTSLLVIVVTAVIANLGLVPTVGQGSPVYDHSFGVVLDLAVFWLLLNVRLRALLDAGPQMLVLFVLGALGVAAGVTLGMWSVGGATERFGEQGPGLGAMFVGTYTGGSANFNLLARDFGVQQQPALYAGAAVLDSLMTTVWMVLGVLLPRWLGARGDAQPQAAPQLGVEEDTEALHPLDLALLAGVGAAAVALSGLLAELLRERLGWEVPTGLVLTTLALVLAQVPMISRLKGTRTLGMFAVYVFLAAIGALCDVHALVEVGALGGWILLFVSVTLTVHGLITFGGARLLRISPQIASVASQANVGGGSTALALARSLGRPDLVLPALLVGNLGTALGSYLGYFVGLTVLGGELASS